MTYLIIASTTSLGIFLSGLENVHWLLFVPPGMLFFAAATGFCPGLYFWRSCGLK